MKKFSVKVTATITKIEIVEVDDTGLSDDEIEDMVIEQAHEQFSCLNDGTEEDYEEEAEIIC